MEHTFITSELLYVTNCRFSFFVFKPYVPGGAAVDHTTNPNHQGFRFIGKLKGVERNLFQCLLSTFVEKHCRNVNDYFDAADDVDNIWHRASPHLRASICAEVAVGLLVPDEPLPPENILHYAIFKFIMDDMLQEEIECEIDQQYMEEDRANGHSQTALERDDLVRRVEHTQDVGRSAMEETRKSIKHDQARTERAGEVDPEALKEKTLRGKRATTFEEIKKFLNFQPPPASVDGDKEGNARFNISPRYYIKDVQNSLPYYQHVRGFFHNLMIQRAAEKNGGRDGVCVPMLPDPKCGDMDLWRPVISMYLGHLIYLTPADQAMLSFRRSTMTRGALHARRLFLRQQISGANAKFEHGWTPAKGSQSIRYLMALCEHLPFLQPAPDRDGNEFTKAVDTIRKQIDALTGDPDSASPASAAASTTTAYATHPRGLKVRLDKLRVMQWADIFHTHYKQLSAGSRKRPRRRSRRSRQPTHDADEFVAQTRLRNIFKAVVVCAGRMVPTDLFSIEFHSLDGEAQYWLKHPTTWRKEKLQSVMTRRCWEPECDHETTKKLLSCGRCKVSQFSVIPLHPYPHPHP